MTTAREQARKAARKAYEDKRDYVYQHNRDHPNVQIELRVSSGEYADAASDVWEPLLRDLVEEVAPLVMQTGKGWKKFGRAVQALGGLGDES